MEQVIEQQKPIRFNTKKYIESYEKIKNKEGRIIPFVLNPPQTRLYNIIKRQRELGKPVRIIILKARQMGFSTLIAGLMAKETMTNKNIKAGIITHQDKSTKAIFDMEKTIYYNLPEEIRPVLQASNTTELVFDTKDKKGLGSSISVMTAGMTGVGRGETYQFLHVSEYAFWDCKGVSKEEQLRGLLQAVPYTPNSMVFIESTANGYDEFRTRWYEAVKHQQDNDVDGFIPVFFAWFEHPEYRMRYTGFPFNEKEKELIRKYNVTPEQLQWRRWSIVNNCGGDEKYFDQEYPSCPEDAFQSTGSCIFNKEAINSRIQYLESIKEQFIKGYFTYSLLNNTVENAAFEENSRGYITIFQKPNPLHYYVIGGDTAGDGSDYFVAQVIDNCSGDQVAIMRQQFDEDLFAEQIYCLGKYYNDALIGLETNFSTYPQKRLQQLGYEKFYIRQKEDTFSGSVIKSYGFRTTTKTRPNIIGNLVKLFREDIECIFSLETLLEALTFVKGNDGKPVALTGSHDDCIMSIAIAYYIRDQQEAVPLEDEEITYKSFVDSFITNKEEESEGWGF